MAWLSLDAADSDPVRFWRHAIAALDRARPGIGERVAPLLSQPRASFEGLVTALINELAAQPGEDELLLVLDDYHLVDAQHVHVSLAFLLEHLPPGLCLVVASRSDPPLLREATGADLAGPAVAALAARRRQPRRGLSPAGSASPGHPR